jgi:uncharacterized protein YkwD
MANGKGKVPTIGLVLGVLAGCIATTPSPRPPVPPADPEAILSGLVEAHNRARAAAGLSALEVDDRLTRASQEQARFMAERRRMSHRGRGGSSPFQRIEAQGYAFRRAGENVAAGRFAGDALMQTWMHSPGHRRNILGAFSQIGAAYATAEDGTTYWCVTFGDLSTR